MTHMQQYGHETLVVTEAPWTTLYDAHVYLSPQPPCDAENEVVVAQQLPPAGTTVHVATQEPDAKPVSSREPHAFTDVEPQVDRSHTRAR